MITPEVEKRLSGLNRKSILLTGLEAHVCVFQTALDLLEKKYEVHILDDCVSSQNKKDRKIAIEVGYLFVTTLSVWSACIISLAYIILNSA